MVSGGTVWVHSSTVHGLYCATSVPTYLVVVRHVKVVLGEVRLGVVRRRDDPVSDHVPAPSPTRQLISGTIPLSPVPLRPLPFGRFSLGSLVRVATAALMVRTKQWVLSVVSCFWL